MLLPNKIKIKGHLACFYVSKIKDLWQLHGKRTVKMSGGVLGNVENGLLC